jgi:hypothetical protein
MSSLLNTIRELEKKCEDLTNERDTAIHAMARIQSQMLTNEQKWKQHLKQNMFCSAREMYHIIIKRLIDSYDEKFNPSYMIEYNNTYVPLTNSHMDMSLKCMPSNACVYDALSKNKIYKANENDIVIQTIGSHNHVYRQRNTPTRNIHYDSNSGCCKNAILRGISEVDPTLPVECLPSELLCELAEKFSFYGKQYTFDRERTQLFIKPSALNMWLNISQTRPELKKIRIVTHGTTCTSSELISKDANGFSFCNAGQNGEVKGRGIYCSLGDMISTEYTLGEPKGTMLLILLLSTENMDDTYGSWTLYEFGTQFKNVVAIHESCLLLVLGKVVPSSTTECGRAADSA